MLTQFFLRRMLRVSWTDFVTKEEVLTRAGTHRTPINNIRKRQCEFFGHILRKGKHEHLTFTGKIKGNKSRGRPRMTYITSLRKWLNPNLSIEKLVHEAYHRSN